MLRAQVVLNNFKGPDEQVKLMSVIFQKMFPPINIKTVPTNRPSCYMEQSVIWRILISVANEPHFTFHVVSGE